jgi:hypothetical protein
MLFETVKNGLMGLEVKDAALVNQKGIKCVRLLLGDEAVPLVISLEDAELAIARKPMSRSLSARRGGFGEVA